MIYRYSSDQTTYKEKINSIIKLSQERIYDRPNIEDKHYLIFDKYDPSKHESVRQSMFTKTIEEKPSKVGHSWVNSGSFKPLSRAVSPTQESES